MHILFPLDPPRVPEVIDIVSLGTCHMQVKWVLNDPAPMTAAVDEVLLEQRDCSYDDASCDKAWVELTTHPSNVRSCNVSLLPNQDYSFRLTSCNDLYGCGLPEIVAMGVDTYVQG